MALNFPDAIKVTLGSYFDGDGFGLNVNDEIPTYRNGGSWYEKETSPGSGTGDPTAASDNRVKLSFGTFFGDTLHRGELFLVTSGSGNFYTQYAARWSVGGLGSSVYTFLDVWDFGTGYIAFSGAADFGSFEPGAAVWGNKDNMFSSMEEYIPPSPGRAPDKTTYRYG